MRKFDYTKSLSYTHPKIASEWHPTKNGDLTPDRILPGSHLKVWWRCEKGHEWQTNIYHRITDGGCPFCSGHRVLPGENDLASLNPALASEWNYSRNGDLTPQDVSSGSNKKVWWRCKLGHEWEAQINSRSKNGNGCPFCSNQRVLKGYNDFATTNPELLTEWDYQKNDVTPQQIVAGSGKKYWWRCEFGHEWQASVAHRKKGVGCPICAGQVVLAGYNDLSTTNPNLAAEWHPTKNGSLTPQQVTSGSSKKVWWMCTNGHEWKAGIGQRNGSLGCPICSNKQVLTGFNDLATTNPEIAAEWNYEKNKDLLPNMVTAGSNKYVWWKCKNGHEWRTQVNARLQGAGCAECSAHLKTSFPEQAVFFYVRQTYPDAINGFREIFSSRNTIMELDIYIPSVKTAIEYDGRVWHSSSNALKREGIKYQICKAHGIKLIRIKENAEDDTASCDILIHSDYSDNYRHFNNTLVELSQYIALPSDINCNRDKNLITAQYMPDMEMDSLFYTNHELMQEWNYERNTDISPKNITASSPNKVWWRCEKGHEWQAKIRERVRGTKCPYCSGNRIAPGFNDLATVNPKLAAEWHPTKNGELTPQAVTSGSNKKVWWLCAKGHEWQAQINARNRGNGCPFCAKKK